ncbi:MAG: YciI family protein [Propionicimonas sp.]|nr:YciI family protein [Propionicimonas sp.]
MSEQYVVFIVEPEWDPTDYSPEDFKATGDQHRAFAEAVAEAGGKVLGGEALQPSRAAVRISPATATSEAVFTDGPFPELKELVTGYYLLEMPDEASARRVAALCPSAGRLELWPVFDTANM